MNKSIAIKTATLIAASGLAMISTTAFAGNGGLKLRSTDPGWEYKAAGEANSAPSSPMINRRTGRKLPFRSRG